MSSQGSSEQGGIIGAMGELLIVCGGFLMWCFGKTKAQLADETRKRLLELVAIDKQVADETPSITRKPGTMNKIASTVDKKLRR